MKKFDKDFFQLINSLLLLDNKKNIIDEFVKNVNKLSFSFSIEYHTNPNLYHDSIAIKTSNNNFGCFTTSCDPSGVSTEFSALFNSSVIMLAQILEKWSDGRAENSEKKREMLDLEQLQKFKINESLYQGMEKLSKVGGWEYDVKDQSVFWTPEVYRIYGYDSKNFTPGTQMRVEDSLNGIEENDRIVLLENFEKCVNEGVAYEVELPLITQKGKRIWIKTAAKAIKKQGKIVKVQGNIIDITKRKLAELELQESHLDIKVRHEIANIFLIKSDERVYSEILKLILSIVKSNHGFLGYIDERGDLVCPTITENIWSKSLLSDKSMTLPRKAWGGLWGKSLLQKKSFIKEVSLSIPEGHVSITRAMTIPIKLKNKLIGLIAVANKESEYTKKDQRRVESVASYIAPLISQRLEKHEKEVQRNLAIQKLEENERLLRKIADNYPHSFVAIIEKDYTISFTSGQEYQKQYIEPGQFIGKTISNVFGEKANTIETSLKKSFKGKEISFEAFLKDQCFLFKAVPLFTRNKVNRILLVVENITQRVHLSKMMGIERDLGVELAKVSTIQQALNVCLDYTLKIPGIDCGGIYRADFQNQQFELWVHKGVSDKFVKNVNVIPFSEEEGRQILAINPLYLSFDLLKKLKQKFFIAEGFKSAAVLPIHHRKQVIGCINLVSKTSSEIPEYLHTFFENIVSLLGSILINIENQQVIRDSEERYRNFIMNASEGIYRIDFKEPIPIDLPDEQLSQLILNKAVVGEVNEAIANMYNLNVKDMFGKPVIQIVPDYGKRALLAIRSPQYQVTDIETIDYDLKGVPIYLSESFRAIIKEGKLHRIWGMQRNITEQKFAAQKLENSQHHLAEAQRIGKIGSYIMEVETGETFWSNQMFEIFGFDNIGNTPKYKEIRSRVHPEDIPLFENASLLIRNLDPPVNVQYRIILPDNTVKWVVMRNEMIYDEKGKPIEVRGTIQDITDRKQIEIALQKRLLALTRPFDYPENILFEELFNIEDIQRLQDLFSTATGVASIITHLDGTPITKPSNFCVLCKDVIRKTDKGLKNCYHSDAVLGKQNVSGAVVQPCLSGGLWDAGASITVGGKHIANWLIGQVRNETQSEENMLEYAREIGADEKEFIKAFRQVPKMSSVRFHQVADALYVIASQLSNSAYQNIQQARFISDRNHAQIALQESEARLKSYIENAPDGIFVVDENGFCVDVNPAGCIMSGYSRKEILEMHLTFMVIPEEREYILNHFNTVVNKGVAKGVFTFVRKDKKKRYWTVDAVKLSDVRFLGFLKDITKSRQAEIQIKNSLDEKNVMLKEIHHRVKNNLQVMRSLISLQLRSEKSDAFKASAIELSNRILSMALVHEQLYQSESMAEIQLDSYITILCEELLSSMSRDDVVIHQNLQDIKMDIEKSVPLGLVINELVTNAVKHAFTENGNGRIDLSLYLKNNTCELQICDNGKGIPPDINLEKPSTLGLELVNILARQLDGSVNFKSKNGTKVTLTFPA